MVCPLFSFHMKERPERIIDRIRLRQKSMKEPDEVLRHEIASCAQFACARFALILIKLVAPAPEIEKLREMVDSQGSHEEIFMRFFANEFSTVRRFCYLTRCVG